MRFRLALQGTVQGVGFRPFVYRLATSLGLAGWVSNSASGALIEVEGTEDQLQRFTEELEVRKPVHCFFSGCETSLLDSVGYAGFEIRESLGGDKLAVILPDIATCSDCRAELFDPSDRRRLYPFINCTRCGPRYTIIERLPYDRANTSMKAFPMCGACRGEYEDPADRRFHAQPNACPVCGPEVELWDPHGRILAGRTEAIERATAALKSGQILAAKGIGGFHLLVDARHDEAILRLRRLKNREEKPFALMYPGFAEVERDCRVSEREKALLVSPAAPIVLLERAERLSSISEHVAPRNPYLGVMLPYSPLHLVLLAGIDFPLVATSGNLKDEPIATDEKEALERLGSLVDLFLVHNRPIVRPVDDSVVRFVMGREMVVRRARGYAPLPLFLPTGNEPVLAVGGQLKSTVSLAVASRVFVSQHLGDLETPEAMQGFEQAIDGLKKLYEKPAAIVACDAHPAYESSRYARSLGLPVVEVQHHYAHVLACMAENDVPAPVLGVSWDGTGYGSDGTVWGGEFLAVDERSFRRFAHLRTFPLPGSERAVREPRRSALGVLYELFGAAAFEMNDLSPVQAFSESERRILRGGLEKRINAPLTSSAGRLFDAVSSIAGLRQVNNFEGQGAMELEFAADRTLMEGAYHFELHPSVDAEDGPILIDWGPVIRDVLIDTRDQTGIAVIASRFHNALADMVIAVAEAARLERVVLTGGCFQNKHLSELTITRLRKRGFRPYWHQRIPPNDGGISVGQVMAVLRERQVRLPNRTRRTKKEGA